MISQKHMGFEMYVSYYLSFKAVDLLCNFFILKSTLQLISILCEKHAQFTSTKFTLL